MFNFTYADDSYTGIKKNRNKIAKKKLLNEDEKK